MTALDTDDVRTEALFVSDLQRSQQPTPEVIRAVVSETVDRLGENGCAALVAQSSASTRTARSAACGGPGPRSRAHTGPRDV